MVGIFLLYNHDSDVRSAFVIAQIAVVIDAAFLESVTNKTVASWRCPSESVFNGLQHKIEVMS